MTTVVHPPLQGSRTIRFPLSEHEDERLLSDRTSAKTRLQELSEDSPALFPAAFLSGYVLYRSSDHCSAHRTSTLVDRLMTCLDRACGNAQYCHGTFEAAESRVRALALLGNFCPSSPGTVSTYHGQACPAERLNGKRYAENGLENLLISGSMNGVEMDQQNPL